MNKQIFLSVAVVVIIVVVLFLVFFFSGKEKLEGGSSKSCCVGCDNCHAYTEKAKKIMDKEGRSTPVKVEGILVDMRCYSQDIRNYKDTHYTPEGKKIPGCVMIFF